MGRGELRSTRLSLMADERIVAAVYEALAKLHPKSRSRGRLGAPAEVVLRLLILKHVRNWSYHVLEREVRANLVYRDFTRVGGGNAPDAKTMGRWGLAVDPDTIKRVHDRMVQIAQQHGATAAVVGDRSHRTCQRTAQPPQAQAELLQAIEHDEPGGGPGEPSHPARRRLR